MKIVKFISLLPDRSYLLPPRLKHGRLHASLSHLNQSTSICFIEGFSSSSSNFIDCTVFRESASVYADYLKSYFSVSQPKALRSKARGYLSELRRATCSEKSHSSFCFPFYSTATSPDKVAHSMLKYLPPSEMDLLGHIINLSWSLHSFPSIQKDIFYNSHLQD